MSFVILYKDPFYFVYQEVRAERPCKNTPYFTRLGTEMNTRADNVVELCGLIKPGFNKYILEKYPKH